ncbi:MAG: DUF547 domain-containing protein [Acidobacteria bacterium]|nr:MAG: DUF547 domain-containing protein [Acidobacteriota bacterium]
MTRMKILTSVVLVALALVFGSCSSMSGPASPVIEANRATSDQFSYEAYAAILEAYVDERGLVDYDGLKADRQRLDAFARVVATLDPHTYEQWNEAEKIAFWINAYNALTLEAIIAHYPIKPRFGVSLIYPKNSIRQIPGVWDKLTFEVMGRAMTLDEIEHDVLRAKFHEPRIHMALVCAARGCPPLRNEPYVGDRLDEQLDDQARRFLSNPEKFRIDRRRGIVYLSSIFKWFGGDFVNQYGGSKRFPGHRPEQRAVLHFISRYLDPADREYLEKGAYKIEYLDYDWSLNEQRRQ